jgi:hypothetical protein
MSLSSFDNSQTITQVQFEDLFSHRIVFTFTNNQSLTLEAISESCCFFQEINGFPFNSLVGKKILNMNRYFDSDTTTKQGLLYKQTKGYSFKLEGFLYPFKFFLIINSKEYSSTGWADIITMDFPPEKKAEDSLTPYDQSSQTFTAHCETCTTGVVISPDIFLPKRKVSTLNPNAKIFLPKRKVSTLNPNAKIFLPKRKVSTLNPNAKIFLMNII